MVLPEDFGNDNYFPTDQELGEVVRYNPEIVFIGSKFGEDEFYGLKIANKLRKIGYTGIIVGMSVEEQKRQQWLVAGYGFIHSAGNWELELMENVK